MGYCIIKIKSHIFIEKGCQDGALKELKQFAKIKEDITWVSMTTLFDSKTLIEALDEIGWRATCDDFGNIIEFEYMNEKIGDELEIFNSIAKYVNEGSYIEMYGEDGDLWRWVFKNGECKEIQPTITWG